MRKKRKKQAIKSSLLAVLLFLLPFFSYSWGFWAHKRINRQAVFTLPTELLQFYKQHIEYVTKHAVDPDKRKFAVEEEAPRHYIDIDHYGTYPFENVPRYWDKAVEKFTEDTLKAYGVLPWHTVRVFGWLTQAFKEKDKDKILSLSADIGHYIADACVPLHTTVNYDGQLTGQKGIHAFWESRIPELFGDNYNYFVGKAKYVGDPLDRIWKVILKSHTKVDSVLSIEKELSRSFSQDRMYVYDERGTRTEKEFSKDYSKTYQERLNNMIERRMRKAIKMVGNFWYSAWINAGQPDLSTLE